MSVASFDVLQLFKHLFQYLIVLLGHVILVLALQLLYFSLWLVVPIYHHLLRHRFLNV